MKNIKNIVVIIAALSLVATGAANAQTSFSISKTEVGSESLNGYKEQRMEVLPYIQAYQAEDGTILKAADAIGWGIEVSLGGGYLHADEAFTPEFELSFRYDAKKVSYRVTASALMREYNAESINPGQMYGSYAADGAVHINLLRDRFCVNVLNMYATIGYMYGQHRYAVKIEADDGVWSTVVKHNGSGVTYGLGLEYRMQLFATGNALVGRIGYKTVPNTYVNNTRTEGMVYLSVGFNFGCSRSRVK